MACNRCGSRCKGAICRECEMIERLDDAMQAQDWDEEESE